jgi:hypothetical protein
VRGSVVQKGGLYETEGFRSGDDLAGCGTGDVRLQKSGGADPVRRRNRSTTRLPRPHGHSNGCGHSGDGSPGRNTVPLFEGGSKALKDAVARIVTVRRGGLPHPPGLVGSNLHVGVHSEERAGRKPVGEAVLALIIGPPASPGRTGCQTLASHLTFAGDLPNSAFLTPHSSFLSPAPTLPYSLLLLPFFLRSPLAPAPPDR